VITEVIVERELKGLVVVAGKLVVVVIGAKVFDIVAPSPVPVTRKLACLRVDSLS